MLIKATRDALGYMLPIMGEKYKNIIALDCDLGKATKLASFGEKFPDRFFQMGIAEANAIGVASGLSQQGFKVFLASFGSFLTGRYDTIRCSIAYANAPVVLVGTHGGLAIGRDGATQMGLEDITLMRALPNMTIYNPGSYHEACVIIERLCSEELFGPVYLRLGRQPVSDPIRIFTAYKEDPRLVIYSTGCITHEVIKALQDPRLIGLRIEHVHVNQIKPLGYLDMPIADKIITVEDHLIAGGFGSAIAEEFNRPVHKIGIPDLWVGSGKPEDLYKKYNLDSESLATRIETIYHNND